MLRVKKVGSGSKVGSERRLSQGGSHHGDSMGSHGAFSGRFSIVKIWFFLGPIFCEHFLFHCFSCVQSKFGGFWDGMIENVSRFQATIAKGRQGRRKNVIFSMSITRTLT